MRPNRTVTTSTPADLPTRSSLRRAQTSAPVVSGTSKKRGLVTITVMTLTAGLIGTMALPAFASTPVDPNASANTTGASSTVAAANGAQSLAVSADAAPADAGRDSYTATSQETLNAAAVATQREAERAALAASYASYTGPTAAENVASSAAASGTGTAATPTAFSLSAVYNTALQYLGTPYVFGGATPAGFDCSGFVMFVYSQYGISLPHSVTRQGAMGTPITAAEAQPGDVIIFDDGSHDGFYAGDGMILDAPKPGGVVSVRPLWTSAVHYVRFGS